MVNPFFIMAILTTKTNFFQALKLNLRKESQQNSFSLVLNSTLNQKKNVIFNNFLIFSVNSSICFLVFKLLAINELTVNPELILNFLAWIVAILAMGIFCYFTTSYFFPNILIKLKKIKLKKIKFKKPNFKKTKKDKTKKEESIKIKV